MSCGRSVKQKFKKQRNNNKPAVERRHAANFSSSFSVARRVEEVLSIDRCPYELLNGMCSLTYKQRLQSLLHFVMISNANEEPSV